MRCPGCSTDNWTDARFCEQCGTSLEGVCPRCATANSPAARFCRNCGSPLSAARPGPADSRTQPPPSPLPDRLASLQQSAPPALVDQLRAAAAHVEGERKPVTILFTDIVGSTTLAEKLDPEEWKEIVSGAHQRVSAAVYRYEGTIAQLLGDGVLAFFGAPITHEDDPVRAVRAALEIQAAVGEYARSLAGYVDSFQMRIGLHSGVVVVGAIGSDLHMEYLAIGDAVNIAARLQSACAPGAVLISEATAKRVRAEFELEDLGEVTVKGKSEPLHVFRPIAPKAVPASGRGIEGLASPLVGREAQVALLRERLNSLFEGQGQIVCITGEAGIGKSRLVGEVVGSGQGSEGSRQSAEGRGQVNEMGATVHHPLTAVHWVEGRSLSYGQALSFWAMTQLLKNDLGLSDGDPEPRVRANLRRRLQALDAERAGDLFPYLAHLLGIKLEGEAAERIHALDGETLKRQTLVSLEKYWSRVAAECPTVLVLEDLHWADPSTLDALEHLLPLTDRAPVMLLLIFRLETDKGCWRLREKAARDFHHRFTEIELAPLSGAQSNELVNNLLAIAELPAETRKLILDRSEGNPFYLEEIVRSLIEQGAIARAGDHWRATAQIQGVIIPETLQGLLLARIDRLEEEARRTLQLASVIGQSFLYRLLQAIAQAERELDAQLAQLQRVDLVREKTRRPELEYMFKHSLTQQAAYDSLLLEQRRDFHRRVGMALEQIFADRQEEFYGLLAHHFDRAGDRAKAVEYLLRAGDKMRLEDAQEEAAGYYRRAVELLEELGDDVRAARTWLKLGLVYHTNFDFEAAHRANEMAFALQKKIAPRRRSGAANAPAADGPAIVLKLPTASLRTLDPGGGYWMPDVRIVTQVFAGLAELDEEMNLIPHAARSWEVLDGGTRYVVHLRDDVLWTDGTRVTATDFEWAWKRNLRLFTDSPHVGLFDHIVGARDYREGKNPDPESMHVRALDELTLEVRLNEPVAYFPYVLAAPFTFPLPRATIERWGDEWWKPEHMVSNGAFRLTEVDIEKRVVLRRNPDYFGDWSGNLDGIDLEVRHDEVELPRDMVAGKYDILETRLAMPREIPSEWQTPSRLPATHFCTFAPTRPPLDDIRVRRALMLAFDRQRYVEFAAHPGARAARGGLVPPGLPGHTPEMGIVYDLPAARMLLAQAGYPDGEGFPALRAWAPANGLVNAMELARMWKKALGINVNFEAAPGSQPGRFQEHYHLVLLGWVADFPDPANFLQDSSMSLGLKEVGWQDARYDALVEQGAHATNRAQRMAMYREADRILVAEQTLVLPIGYNQTVVTLIVQPWIENAKMTLLGVRAREVVKRRRQ